MPLDSAHKKRTKTNRKATSHRFRPKKNQMAKIDLEAFAHDSERRAFLKTMGAVGVGAFFWSLFPKRASALMFGSSAGSDPSLQQTVQELQDIVTVQGDPGNMALTLYNDNPGATFTISGPKVLGSDPPIMHSSTQAFVDYYVSLGIPEANLLWSVTGEVAEGSSPSASMSPSISASASASPSSSASFSISASPSSSPSSSLSPSSSVSSSPSASVSSSPSPSSSASSSVSASVSASPSPSSSPSSSISSSPSSSPSPSSSVSSSPSPSAGGGSSPSASISSSPSASESASVSASVSASPSPSSSPSSSASSSASSSPSPSTSVSSSPSSSVSSSPSPSSSVSSSPSSSASSSPSPSSSVSSSPSPSSSVSSSPSPSSSVSSSPSSSASSSPSPSGSPVYTDNFNRADGGLGANWTTSPGKNAPQISSNAVAPQNAAGAYYSGATFSGNHYASSTTGGYLTVRNQSGNAYYYQSDIASGNDGYEDYLDFYIWRVDGGGNTQIAHYQQYPAAGVITNTKLEANGSTIALKAYQGGSWITGCSATDTNLTGGAPGFQISLSIGFDNFEGGDL